MAANCTPTELVSDTLDLIDEMSRLGLPLLEEDKMLIGLATSTLSVAERSPNQTAGVDRLLAVGLLAAQFINWPAKPQR